MTRDTSRGSLRKHHVAGFDRHIGAAANRNAHVGGAQRRRDAPRDGLRVTSHHDDVDPRLVQRIHRGARFGPQHIGYREDRHDRAVLNQEDRRLAAVARTPGGRA
jgi:hypothetical protein